LPDAGPIARSLLIAVSWSFAVVGLVAAKFVHEMVIGLTGFTMALFFSVSRVAPLWTAT
jgi:hypothetical protein